MTKKQFYFLLILIFLIIFVFLIIVFLDFRNESNTAREPSETGSNSLNLGQTSEELWPNDLNSTIYFCPEDNCNEKIISLIIDSNNSIDCAVYDITSKEIADSLISEKEKGNQIRIVTDYGRSSTKTSQVGNLKYSGINVLISPSESSYMHNKFCVFDDSAVLIGSTNFTENSFSESYNNIMVFDNPKLANILTEKINSFYLGNFSKSSTVLGQDISSDFSIYFCPNQFCESSVLDKVKEAKKSIVCMMYSFTLDNLAEELIKAKENGIEIRLILENQQITQYSEYQKLKANGIDVILDNQPNLLHNKFCVIDEETLITGSMNFSLNGINNNDESLLIIKDKNLSMQYYDYFKTKWNEWNKEYN